MGGNVINKIAKFLIGFNIISELVKILKILIGKIAPNSSRYVQGLEPFSLKILYVFTSPIYRKQILFIFFV